MRYKPTFCCHCGEKIERPNPSFTDSKMFCDVCKHDFVLPRAAPVVFAVLMLMVGLFGIGGLWRGGEKTAALATRQLAANPPVSSKNAANIASPVSSNQNAPQAAQTNSVQTNAPGVANLKTDRLPKQTETSPVTTDEAVYFCGAMTKKGTPCSRRVKGGGRCWQHKGQAAMLPPDKLLASR
jgi:hypothetical protein